MEKIRFSNGLELELLTEGRVFLGPGQVVPRRKDTGRPVVPDRPLASFNNPKS